MPDAWYFMDNGRQMGPMSAGELKQHATAGRVLPQTSVWKEGLAEWVPASRIKGLFAASTVQPPAPPVSMPPPPPPTFAANGFAARTFGSAAPGTGGAPRVLRKSDNEVIISVPRAVAFNHVGQAFEKLGKVTARDPQQNYIDGRIKYGLNSVKVRASLVERDPGQTTVVMQGSSGEVWGVAARNAAKRMVAMLENFDNPAFKADRLGMHPLALAGVVLLFVLIIVGVVAVVG